MNSLNKNLFNTQGNQQLNKQSIPSNLQKGIQQVKQMMQLSQGDLDSLIEQDPQISGMLKMFKGQNLQSVFYEMCRSQNIDPNAILNELR